mmetsp:Transcript_1357/g.3110  ORF Transcript_1357/g.3110 Transcript_1357/m.3110 type:complete len:158 (-) Transcript_1357:760-1233(-)
MSVFDFPSNDAMSQSTSWFESSRIFAQVSPTMGSTLTPELFFTPPERGSVCNVGIACRAGRGFRAYVAGDLGEDSARRAEESWGDLFAFSSIRPTISSVLILPTSSLTKSDQFFIYANFFRRRAFASRLRADAETKTAPCYSSLLKVKDIVAYCGRP